jgi:hypothetical protein
MRVLGATVCRACTAATEIPPRGVGAAARDTPERRGMAAADAAALAAEVQAALLREFPKRSTNRDDTDEINARSGTPD